MAWAIPTIPVTGAVIQAAWGVTVRDDLVELESHNHDGTAGQGSNALVLGVGGYVVAGHTAKMRIGTPTPNLSYVGTDGNAIGAVRYTNSAGPVYVSFAVSRSGVIGTPGIITNGDEILRLEGAADDGVDLATVAASIRIFSDGVPSAGVIPGRVEIWTATSAGSLTKALNIGRDQVVAVIDTTDASSSTAAAFKSAGGIAVAKSLWVGGPTATIGGPSVAGVILKLVDGDDPILAFIENTTTRWSIGNGRQATDFNNFFVIGADSDPSTSPDFALESGGMIHLGIAVATEIAIGGGSSVNFSSTGSGVVALYRSTTGVGNAVNVGFDMNDSAGNRTAYATILGLIGANNTGAEDGVLLFRVIRSASQSDAMRIDAFTDIVSIDSVYILDLANTTEATTGGAGAATIAGGLYVAKSIYAATSVAVGGSAAPNSLKDALSARQDYGTSTQANLSVANFWMAAAPNGSFDQYQVLYVQGPSFSAANAGTTNLASTVWIGQITTYNSTRVITDLSTVTISNESSDGGGVATNNMGALWIRGGGITVGNRPTGNTKGTGTINVSSDIYKNNSAYNNPDYVFEFAFTGKIERFIQNDGARAYLADGGFGSLESVELYARQNLKLPHLGNPIEGVGIFERADSVLLHIEQVYLYLFDHASRIKRLESELASLKLAA